MTEPTWYERIAAAVDAFITAQGCRCQRVSEEVYTCPAHTVDAYEAQYGADLEKYAQRIIDGFNAP
jgi:hypothetical protein